MHIGICNGAAMEEAIWKGVWKERNYVTHWREQRGVDSYLQRQIRQSDCEISSNCGTNHYPLDKYYQTLLRYPVDSDLSNGSIVLSALWTTGAWRIVLNTKHKQK